MLARAKDMGEKGIGGYVFEYLAFSIGGDGKGRVIL